LQIPLWSEFVTLLQDILLAIDSVVHNAGLSIIVFTFLVTVVTWPLSLKSVRSMREMQRFQPVMKEIAKKYKDDPAKKQAETMRVYQTHGYNPMSSCFPLLLQMPIIAGLYQAMSGLVSSTTADAAHHAFTAAPFLWLTSIAHPDPYYIWPVLSGVFQFFSNRMAQPYGANKNADPQQAMMNKMMGFLPIYLIIIYSGVPAGLVIYWTFRAVFGAIQSYVFNGWGTLPDLPGFKWLPIKPPPPISPEIQREIDEISSRREERKGATPATGPAGSRTPAYAGTRSTIATTNPDGTPRRLSFMERMQLMAEQAAEQQEQTRLAREQQAAAQAEIDRALGNEESDEKTRRLPADEATRSLAGNGNGKRNRVAANGTFADVDSDSTGSLPEMPTGSNLPRKRRK
jgi:YidC/Oxa1 family membrane protein insertase